MNIEMVLAVINKVRDSYLAHADSLGAEITEKQLDIFTGAQEAIANIKTAVLRTDASLKRVAAAKAAAETPADPDVKKVQKVMNRKMRRAVDKIKKEAVKKVKPVAKKK